MSDKTKIACEKTAGGKKKTIKGTERLFSPTSQSSRLPRLLPRGKASPLVCNIYEFLCLLRTDSFSVLVLFFKEKNYKRQK